MYFYHVYILELEQLVCIYSLDCDASVIKIWAPVLKTIFGLFFTILAKLYMTWFCSYFFHCDYKSCPRDKSDADTSSSFTWMSDMSEVW